MVVTFLNVHILICLAVAYLIKKEVIMTRMFIMPAVCFLPVCGLVMLAIEEYAEREGLRGKKEIGMGKHQIEDIKYMQIAVTEGAERDMAVPLEEAILLNDSATKRKLLMDVLQRNPEDYIELLQEARLSNDTEMAHYATTTMMEIQSGYELALHRIEEQLEVEAVPKKIWLDYRSELTRYVRSGLISGNILNIYREKLNRALEKLMEMEPGNKKYVLEAVDNDIELGNQAEAERLLAECRERWADDEKIYELYVKYYWENGEGEKIKGILKEIEEKNIYLSHDGKKWFDFWNKKEQTAC